MNKIQDKAYESAISAGVDLLMLRSSTWCGIRDLSEVVAALREIQVCLDREAKTLEALSEVAQLMDMKRIDRLLDYVRSIKDDAVEEQAPVEPEEKRFAVDSSTRKEICYRNSIGVPVRRLAEDFGVSQTTVRRYLHKAFLEARRIPKSE